MNRLLLTFIVLLVFALPAHAQDSQAALDDVATGFAAPDDPALVIQVTTPEGTWTAAAGEAAPGRSAGPDDRFRIGSMSKTFVSAAALLLAEDGLLDLDDRAAEWLSPEQVENIANADEVTVRQLLGMRSGIDDYLGTDDFWLAVEDAPEREWTAPEALQYAYGLEPLFAPGEGVSYSNTNYLLAQIVLEEASGQPLHTLVRERILEPLGLRDTYTQIVETLPGGFVEGYEDFDGDGVPEPVSDINDGAGLGDGGLVSTTADLTAFYQALLQDETLLSAESRDAMFDFEDGYGLGLESWETDWGGALGHSGGVLGFYSLGVYLPDEEAIIIVLTASADLDPEEIALEAADAVLGG